MKAELFNYILGLCLGKVDAVRSGVGPKEIKSRARAILEIINTLNSISYNPYFKKKKKKKKDQKIMSGYLLKYK